MTYADFIALLPMVITAYFGTLLMLFTAFKPGNKAAFALTVVGLGAALASVAVSLTCAPHMIGSLLLVDGFSLYFSGLVIAVGLLVALISQSYLRSRVRRSEAFYLLLFFVILGMEVTVSSVHFVSLLLGVETLSISLYGLIGYTREYRPSLEAAIKYLVLAASASAFMLFGIALVYADTGVMGFQQLAAIISRDGISVTTGFGLALILVLFGFKLAIAPFHMWSPDVYQGAPAPVTALIASGSKGAMLAILLRMIILWNLKDNAAFTLTITVLAIGTMFTGNLLALMQTNLKRMLAYSSIAHMGYLLIPLIAGGSKGPSSIAFYLVSYCATVISAFGVIAVVSGARQAGDVEEISAYRGLAFKRPALAAILALAMLSLAGIPPTVGFIAKFYIFSAAAQAGLWGLLIIGVVNSGISAFYYLRLVIALYSREETATEPMPGAVMASAIALAVTAGVMVIFGIYPSPLIRLAEAATRYLAR